MDETISIVIKARNEASGALKTINTSFASLKASAAELVQKIPGVGTAMSIIQNPIGGTVAALGGLYAVMRKTANETMDYAIQVDDMARKLGVSTEEASRLIQVADDLRVDVGTLNSAFRVALKNGIEPSISGLINLSAEYQNLKTPAERAQFAMDKFGRSGLEMQKILEKTPEQLREMARELDGSALIMSKKSVEAAKQYYDSLDDLQDKQNELSITLGNIAIPIWIEAQDTMIRGVTAGVEIGKQIGTITKLLGENVNAYNKVLPSYQEHILLQDRINQVIADNKYEDARDHINRLTEAQIESAKAAKDLADTQSRVAYELIEVEKAAFAREAIRALNAAYEQGSISADSYAAEMRQIMGEWLNMSSAAITATVKMADLKRQLKDGQITALEYADATQALYMTLQKIDGTNVRTTITTTYQVVGQPAPIHDTTPRRRQHGGPVVARIPYLVGERGPEVFVPAQSGRIVPNNHINFGGITVIVNGGGESAARDIIAALQREMRMSSSRGRQFAGA